MEDQSKEQSGTGNKNPQKGEDFVALVYDELRRLAAHRLAIEYPGQTLEATALVNEAWLKLAHDDNRLFNDQQHFYCTAATVMRRILIDNARRKNRPKHGGELHRTTLKDVAPAELMPSDELIALDEALAQLAEVSTDAARLVELRFFAGFSHQEATKIMGVTRGVADGLWAFARSWLFDAVHNNLSAMQSPKSL